MRKTEPIASDKPTERRAGRKPRESAPSGAASERAYHHGALREALLAAAETVLRRDGLRGLTLRAIAREAGVSHTAPQHHFGDTAGVLSDLAAQGHVRLAQAMMRDAEGIADETARRKAIARGYIRFAVEQPDLFRLMSRNELLDPSRESLNEARRASIRALAGVIAKPDEPVGPVDRIRTAQATEMIAGWAYVHGLAMLLIDGRLNTVARITDGMEDAAALVDATLERMRLRPDEAE